MLIAEYFIKVVSPPGLAHMKDNNVPVEFSARAKNMRDQFSKCAGFLLYEKGGKYTGGTGAMRIFAAGRIKEPPEKISPPDTHSGNSEFPFAVIASINITLPDHHSGLSADEANSICPGLDFHPMRKLGGLYELTEKQFFVLSNELRKRSGITFPTQNHL